MIETLADFPVERARLQKTWHPKELGLRYIMTALFSICLRAGSLKR